MTNIYERKSGGCKVQRIIPPKENLSSTTPILNIEISFDDALKLNLALDERIRKIYNKYKRNARAGQSAAVNLCLHLAKDPKKSRITVVEGKMK